MVAQRGLLLRKRAGPLRRTHTESARAGHAGHAGSALSEFWNAWSACSPRSPSGHNGPSDTSFVAGSEKVTFDVKYSGLRPQNPADELCDGRTASSVIAALAKAARVSNEAAIVLEKSVLHRCAACHRVLGRDRGGIVSRGERRKG